MEQKAKMNDLYQKARDFAEKNNAKEARVCLLAAVNILRDLYYDKSNNNIIEKAKFAYNLRKWVDMVVELGKNGVSDKVRAGFALSASVLSTTNGNNEDNIIDTSQGWAADIFEHYKNGIGRIKTSDTTGTGFIISENGYLLTNHHVVFNKPTGRYHDKITIAFGINQDQYSLNVETSDINWDIALCSFKTESLHKFTVIPWIKNYSSVKQGADMLVIGNSFSMGLSPITGTIKYVCDEKSGNLVHTAPSNPGDSGAPVFIRSGKCIGINKSVTTEVFTGKGISSASGMANATPMNRIDEFLQRECAIIFK